MVTETAAKRDTQKLQRAIVDGLEDVKAQDVKVFDTEHLSPLFERVIVASGTSNRQTKALAASVVDAVRDAGFPKPRVEGEGNGEWIIVDCAQAVVHIMQPAYRSYYHLEELWGEKPVRLKFGTSKPAAPAKAAAAQPVPAKSAAGKTGAASKVPAKKAPARAAAGTRPASAAPAKRAAPAKPSGTTAAKGAARPAAKAVAKPAVKKAAPRKAAAPARRPAPNKA